MDGLRGWNPTKMEVIAEWIMDGSGVRVCVSVFIQIL